VFFIVPSIFRWLTACKGAHNSTGYEPGLPLGYYKTLQGLKAFQKIFYSQDLTTVHASYHPANYLNADFIFHTMADEISNKLDDDLSSIKPLFQKLTGVDNYWYWEGQMRSTLVIYRIWEVVSGESPKPPFPIPEPNLIMEEFLELGGSDQDWVRYKISNAKYQRWLKMDTRAAILIRTHLNETHLGKVQGQTSSKGMWDLLAKDLQTNTMAPLLHVHDKIQAVKIDDFKTPTEYVAKMESLL
jgi:gag-polypeptide of LTR copia-type